MIWMDPRIKSTYTWFGFPKNPIPSALPVRLFKKSKRLHYAQSPVTLLFRVPTRGIVFEQGAQLQQYICCKPPRGQNPIALFRCVPTGSILSQEHRQLR
jgi:hypothetical protein